MTLSIKCLSGAAALVFLAGQVPWTDAIQPSREIARERGPEIFNAIHNSMRQWGSSLHHNGMSAFLATVPKGTLLYHGNTAPESPAEPDWLSYEVEHAEQFARDFRPPPRNDTGPPGSPPYDIMPPDYRHDQQHLLSRAEDEVNRGWLHVYQATRPLQLLYVDGMGGAKSRIGSLDFQDYLLRGTRSVYHDFPKPGARVSGGGPMGERERANELCQLSNEWGLDGVIRMEAGFEIIKCDFADGLEEVQALPRRIAGSGPPPRHQFWIHQLEYMRGVAERYHGIGSSRTTVDYSSMVSAFFFPINLTNPNSERSDLPRLSNALDEELADIRTYLVRTIEGRREKYLASVDWQGVADLIVGRYADRIEYMATKINSTGVMAAELDFLLDLFIDYSETNELSGAIPRCTNFYLTATFASSEIDQLIFDAFQTVTSHICTTLFRARELVAKDSLTGNNQSLAASKDILTSLMESLRWSRFMRSPACEVDEAVFIPMWPFGTKQEYGNPHCIDISAVRREGESYWGQED